jgi:hypothetical protein
MNPFWENMCRIILQKELSMEESQKHFFNFTEPHCNFFGIQWYFLRKKRVNVCVTDDTILNNIYLDHIGETKYEALLS